MILESRPLDTPTKRLPKQTLADRYLFCAGLLHMAGFLSDAERRKVHARMMKWKAQMQAKEAKK